MLVHVYSRDNSYSAFHYHRSVLTNTLVDATRADLIAAGLVERLNYPIIAVTVRPFDTDVSDAFDRLVGALNLSKDFDSSSYQLRPASCQICG